MKAKQGSDWPNCRGIADPRSFLVFVDYDNRELDQSPDFFVLSQKDWLDVLKKRVRDVRKRGRNVRITSDGYCIWDDQIGPSGKPYTGMGIKPIHIQAYRDRWRTIERKVAAG